MCKKTRRYGLFNVGKLELMNNLSLTKILAPSLAIMLVACGDSGPDSANSGSGLVTESPQEQQNVAGEKGGNGGNSINEPEIELGPLVPAMAYGTDTRTENRDPYPDLQPILSDAPPTCAPDGRPVATGPSCDDLRAANYYRDSSDTWIDAQVFIPEHREGEKLPVLLHSHGWGGSKVVELPEQPYCEEHLKPYNCPVNDGGGLLSMFGQLDDVLSDLHSRGYIVVSFSQRGFGDSEGQIMVMNPYHETRDAQAVIDWIAERGRSGELPVAVDEAGNYPLGLFGGSYGGGFQLTLAALDDRVDTIVPVGTWHALEQALLPSGAVKGGWGNLLCLLSTGKSRHPLLDEACVGMFFPFIRTRKAMDPTGEIVKFMSQNGLHYLKNLEVSQKPYRDGEKPFKLRPIDSLLIQGNRDVLFPLQEAVDNYHYLKLAGGDVRLLSNQSGHMNPLANQVDGTTSCGGVDMFAAIRTWFDVKLRGADESLLDRIPGVCITLDNEKALIAEEVPGLNYEADKLMGVNDQWRSFSMSIGMARGPQKCEAVYEVPAGERKVLAGIPKLRDFKVKGDLIGGLGVSYMGVCLIRDGQTMLVDDMVTGFVPGDYPNHELIAVGEALRPGDQIGLMAFKSKEHMNFMSTATIGQVTELLLNGFSAGSGMSGAAVQGLIDPLQTLLSGVFVNAYTVSGEVRLPILESELLSQRTPDVYYGARENFNQVPW